MRKGRDEARKSVAGLRPEVQHRRRDQESRDSRRVRRGCGPAVELSEREDEAADEDRGDTAKTRPSSVRERVRQRDGGADSRVVECRDEEVVDVQYLG